MNRFTASVRVTCTKFYLEAAELVTIFILHGDCGILIEKISMGVYYDHYGILKISTKMYFYEDEYAHLDFYDFLNRI